MGLLHVAAQRNGLRLMLRDYFLPTALVRKRKQRAHLPIIIHRHMQIDARGQQAGMAGSCPYFGQRAFPGKGVANKRMSPVVDGQRA